MNLANDYKSLYEAPKSTVTLGFINIHQQSGLDIAKQTMIEDLMIEYNIDIANLSEIHVDDDTFSDCNYINSSFSIVVNNAENRYGTASIVKNNLPLSNIKFDNDGRAIVFDICDSLTIWNTYLSSGNNQLANQSREEYCGLILPQLLLHRREAGVGGGILIA